MPEGSGQYVAIPIPKNDERRAHFQWDGNGVQCPVCESQWLQIIDSRPHAGTQLRRRRCKSCNLRFWTIEVLSTFNGELIQNFVWSDHLEKNP